MVKSPVGESLKSLIPRKVKTLEEIRLDFPILQSEVYGNPLVYLDNAATSQKPRAVIEATSRYYEAENANIHRGVYYLSEHATECYEDVRKKICTFIGGAEPQEIIFTRGTTEAVNLVAGCLGQTILNSGRSVVVTRSEHHSNFVPWQSLALKHGLQFIIVDVDAEGRLDWDSYRKALATKPVIVALAHMSNVTGVVQPVAEIAEEAKKSGARVLLDAAQSAPHFWIDRKKMGPVDFIAFSSHKLFGPTGVGVLWGRESLLKEMDP